MDEESDISSGVTDNLYKEKGVLTPSNFSLSIINVASMSHRQITLLNSEMNVYLLHCGDRTIKASYHGSGEISKGLSEILTHLINRRYVMCGAGGFKTAISKSANCSQVLKYCQYFYNWGIGETRV